MERELVLTGIGGQGIQLAAQVVTTAALATGRHVQLFGSYGGMMRGGETEATIIVGDTPITAPPTISDTWSAIVMHHDYWEPTRDKLGAGSVMLVNESVVSVDEMTLPAGLVVVPIPATELAGGLGNVVAATMVVLGAYARVTELVPLNALMDAVPTCLPAYRTRHVDLNLRALQTGFGLAVDRRVVAWTETAA